MASSCDSNVSSGAGLELVVAHDVQYRKRTASRTCSIVCSAMRGARARAFEQHVADVAGAGERGGAPFANRIQQRVDGGGELGLHLDVADLARPIAGLQILHLGGIGIERVMVDEHRIAFDRAGNVGPDALGIRVHLPHLLLHHLGGVRQVDGVLVALAHLPVVEAGQAGRGRQQRLRLDEAARRRPLRHRKVEVVEAAHHLARQLQVRHLVVAHRDPVRAVDDDVGGLQQRVAEKADAGEVLLGQLLHLLLVGRHPLQPRNRRDHLQQQIQLRVLGHHRLHEEHALLGIEAGADPVGDVVEGVADDLGRYPRSGWSARASRRRSRSSRTWPAGDPVLKRADQVPEVQFSGRAHARHHALPISHSNQPRTKRCTGRSRRRARRSASAHRGGESRRGGPAR